MSMDMSEVALGLATLAKSPSYGPGPFGGHVSFFGHPDRRPQDALSYPDKIFFQADVTGLEALDGCC
jgi:hypothetical protein